MCSCEPPGCTVNMQRQDAGLADLLRRQGWGKGGELNCSWLPGGAQRLDAEVKRLEEGLQAQAQAIGFLGCQNGILLLGQRGSRQPAWWLPSALDSVDASGFGRLTARRFAEAQTRLRLSSALETPRFEAESKPCPSAGRAAAGFGARGDAAGAAEDSLEL